MANRVVLSSVMALRISVLLDLVLLDYVLLNNLNSSHVRFRTRTILRYNVPVTRFRHSSLLG
jgi:hypothetical protein